MSMPREEKASPWRGAGIGLLAGLFGVLPWVIAGGILPLQNLWVDQSVPPRMPFVLLPVSQYYAVQTFALFVVGGVFAGLIVRPFRSLASGMVSLGLFLAHMAIGAQSFTVVALGLGLGTPAADSRAVVYFWGLVAIAVTGIAIAQVGFWMTATARTPIAALGLALVAVPFGTWVTFAISNLFDPWQYVEFVSFLGRWLPPATVGVALIWCGLRPASRAVVWVISLVALFLVPPLMQSISYVLGSRNILGNREEMLSAGVDVFFSMLPHSWPAVVVAAALGAAGAAVRLWFGRSPVTTA